MVTLIVSPDAVNLESDLTAVSNITAIFTIIPFATGLGYKSITSKEWTDADAERAGKRLY